jgi:hypothetical protein
MSNEAVAIQKIARQPQPPTIDAPRRRSMTNNPFGRNTNDREFEESFSA